MNSKRIVIDTDVFIDVLRNSGVSKRIFEGIIDGKVMAFSSVITEAELLSGKECETPEKRDAVEDLLFLTDRIDVTSDIARKAGEFRRKYNVPLLDSIIAATAFHLNAAIVTRNMKHFSVIKEIKTELP